MHPAYTVTTSEIGAGIVASPAPVAVSSVPDELRRRLAEDVWGSPFPYFRSFQDGGWLGGPSMYFGRSGPYPAAGTINDRRAGRNLPLFWSEADLRGFRIMARFLVDTNMFAGGFINRLVDYHIRKGFAWQVTRRGAKKTPYAANQADADPAVARAQQILDEFRDRARWPLRSREAFRRWRRDGEIFARFFRKGWMQLPVVRFVEPEQVGHPDGQTEGPQSFGIEVDADDHETTLAYYVRDPDGDGRDGEWIDADRIIYAKSNTDSSVKRGLPDFFPVHEFLDGTRRLLRNVLETSVTQAAVAWREKFPTATQSQVSGLIPVFGSEKQLPDGNYPGWANGYPGWPYDSSQVRGGGNWFPAGSVIKTEGNREYEDGPVAAGIPNYLQVEQAVLRGCGARWGMPEYFSGDASNNNFASSLVAGSPFAVAVEGCQLEWGVFERQCALKVLEIAAESGLIDRADVAQLDIEVEEPAVVNADPEAETNRRHIMHADGVLSATTWQMQEGLDPSHEQANFKAERQSGMEMVGQPGKPGVGVSPTVGENPAGGGGDGQGGGGHPAGIFAGLSESEGAEPAHGSDEWIGWKIAKLRGDEGYPEDQAIAIAYHMAGRSKDDAAKHPRSKSESMAAGLIQKKVMGKDGKEHTVYVRPDDGAKVSPTVGEKPALSDDQKSAVLAGLDDKLPDAVKADAGIVAKVKDAALTAAAKVYGKMVVMTPAALKVMGALGMVLDTPDDLKTKLGYNPAMSSGTAHASPVQDPMKDALGLSTHTVATIASHVLSHAIVWAKSKMSQESVSGDGVDEAAGLLAELLGDLQQAFGMQVGAPDASTIAAKLREILGA